MEAEDRTAYWQGTWQERRRRCLEDLAELPPGLTPDALAIVREAKRLASIDDPEVHAAADVAALRDRADDLEIREAVLLHRPVANGISLLQIAARELLAGRASAAMRSAPARPGLRSSTSRPRSGFAWFLVVAEDPELSALVSESQHARAGRRPIRLADDLESALESLRSLREGRALVVVNLTLRSLAGRGPHGLDVAAEARRRHHAVLLVTAAGDYLHYWPRLQAAGLTGHDVVIKTRRDFGERLRGRIAELAEPATVPVSYDDDTGHVVWVGDVEVTDLEAQETLVLLALTDHWRTAEGISDASSHTELGPLPGNVPPLISTLRVKLREALTLAESPLASRELIETRRREGPTQYRLAPWLEWNDPPEPVAAPSALPPVLVVEDERDWAAWVVRTLSGLGWTVRTAATVAEVPKALDDGRTPILVVDLSLPDPTTGVAHADVGMELVEEVAARGLGLHVVVLTALGRRDTVRARLFDAGVRTIDVIDKASGRDECLAMLLGSLERAADEIRRGVRRSREALPFHRVVRLERTRIEVDGHAIERLSAREAAVLDVLIAHHNQPVTAELLNDRCYPESSAPVADRRQLNRVHQTFKRLRQKIDGGVGVSGAGASVLRTPHRGARTTYELHGVVTDRVRSSDMRRPRRPPRSRRRAGPPSAFLSYAFGEGAAFAERLDRELSRNGVRTWLVFRDMDESLDFTSQLEQSIHAADVFVACVSRDVLREDSYARREIAYAQRLGKRIAVARFEDVLPPISIVTNTFYEFHEDWDAAFTRLLAFCRAGPPHAT